MVVFLAMMSTTINTAGHRRRAASTGERISRQGEGAFIAIALRASGLILFVGTLTYLFFPSISARFSVPIPSSMRWLGLPFAIVGPALMAWTLHHLGENLTDTVAVRSNARLVETGPYRWIRHPFYTSAATVMLGVALLSANSIIGVSSIAVLSLLAYRTDAEEQRLVDRFGDAYREYRRRTGRFLPRWGESSTRDDSENGA